MVQKKYFIGSDEEGFLPLQKPLVVERRPEEQYVEGFDFTLPADFTRREVKMALMQKYDYLEGEAARGTLDEKEQKIWQKICEYVDRYELTRTREEANPTRIIAQIEEDEEGKRHIRSTSDLVYRILPSAEKKLKDYDPGKWFEADSWIFGEDGAIRDLTNIVLRPDYQEED